MLNPPYCNAVMLVSVLGLEIIVCAFTGPSLAAAPSGSMISVNTRQLFQEPLPTLPQNQLETAVRTGAAAVDSLAAFETRLLQ